ncbi:bifunctional DNA primase/polymerase [Micrococcus flavus]|nr:hypothetical protein GCM10007073_22660 [Micrococcus flavus]
MNTLHNERRPGVGTRAALMSNADDLASVPGPVSLYPAARELHRAGLNVIPVRCNGSKAPALKAWQRRRTTPADLAAWFAGPRPRYAALGVATGELSGGLELLEIEGPHAHRLAEVYATAEAGGHLPLLRRLNGWAELSPSGGWHLLYRVTGVPVPGNTVLARAEGGGLIAETRGTGGQVILAPTGGTAHPSGRPWERMTGGPGTAPTLTERERGIVHALFRTVLDAHRPRPAEVPRTPASVRPAPAGQLRPGDDFNARADWGDILIPVGWQLFSTHGRERRWSRPGKRSLGHSATTGHAAGADRLFVFSTSAAPFEPGQPYSKFQAHALLHYAGDYRAAAADLRARGYGGGPAAGRC